MGFYGNLNNAKKASFQFDHIYPNRTTMDAECENDGVYVGRYVLVDYNTYEEPQENKELHYTNLKPGYKIITSDGKVSFRTGLSSTSPEFTLRDPNAADEEINVGDIYKNDLIIVCGSVQVTATYAEIYNKTDFGQQYISEQTKKTFDAEIWRCTGKSNDSNVATFEQLSDIRETVYQENYMTDKENQTYIGLGRGWDATVWQKVGRSVKENGETKWEVKYVMIADLNSITPTFDIAYDAPTETPLTPYFDTDSSNVYYRIHMQPQWGMRIKGNNYGYEDISYSLDKKIYPSDVKGAFVIDSKMNEGQLYSKYLNSDGTVSKTTEGQRVGLSGYRNITEAGRLSAYDDAQYNSPLAIYFNKAGFNKYQSSDALIDVKRQHADVGAISIDEGNGPIVNDYIALRPSGLSSNRYNEWTHKGGTPKNAVKTPDTYELSVMLPSIGQTVSDMWDIVYGPNQKTDSNGFNLFNPDTGKFTSWVYRDKDGNVIETEPGKNDGAWLRNTDIAWNSYAGLRANTRFGTGLNAENLETWAGIINSAHDALGMVIRDHEFLTPNDLSEEEYLEEETRLNTALDQGEISSADYSTQMRLLRERKTAGPSDWDPTKIYYIDKTYYMKGKTYDYVSAQVVNEDGYLTWKNKEDENKLIYEKDKQFYAKNENGNYVLITETNNIPIEYERVYNEDLFWKEVNVSPIESANYYRQDWQEYHANHLYNPNGRYYNYLKIKDIADYKEGAVYYTVQDGEIEGLSYDFINNRYFYMNDANELVLDCQSEPSVSGTGKYYELTTKNENGEEISLESINHLSDLNNFKVSESFYIPNKFYAKYEENLRFCTEGTLSAARTNTATAFGLTTDQVNNIEFYESSDVERDTSQEGQISYVKVYKTDENNQPLKMKLTEEVPLSNEGSFSWNKGTGIGTLKDTSGNVIPNGAFEVKREELEWENGEIVRYNSPVFLANDNDYHTPWDIYTDDSLDYPKDAEMNDIYTVGIEYDLVQVQEIEKYKLKDGAVAASLIQYEDELADGSAYYFITIMEPRLDPNGTITTLHFRKERRDALNTTAAGWIRNRDRVYYKLKFKNLESVVFFSHEGDQDYYYQFGDNWYRDVSEHNDITQFTGESPEINLRQLQVNKVEGWKPWEPNKYYTEKNGVYSLAETYDSTETYYEKIGPYVAETDERFKKGAEWTDSLQARTSIAPDLAYRKEKWKAEEVRGLGHDNATLYGLLLKLNKTLLVDDPYSRDIDTLHGAINKMHDIIDEFMIKGFVGSLKTEDGGTGNSSYTGGRLLYTETDKKFASSNIITDGNSITIGHLNMGDGALSANGPLCFNTTYDSPIVFSSDNQDWMIMTSQGLIPVVDNQANLGLPGKQWNTVYSENVQTSNIAAENIEAKDIRVNNIVVEGTISGGKAESAVKDSAGNVITDTYVKKAGDTMTGTLNVPYLTVLAQNNTSEGGEILLAAPSGKYETIIDNYNNTLRFFGRNGSTIKSGVYVDLANGVLYGAAWNDYAEYRESNVIQPGHCVYEVGDGSLAITTERLQGACEIVSDTYGFAIGESKKDKTPIAVSGRVLAYPFEDRNSYKPGDAVCSGPDGTVSKMTEEEIIKYPHKIIGTVSYVPDYEEWGENKVKVNGRIWIRIK